MSRSVSYSLAVSPQPSCRPNPVRVAPPATKSIRLPSQLRIFPAAHAMSGAWVRTRTISSSQWASVLVSLLRNASAGEVNCAAA